MKIPDGYSRIQIGLHWAIALLILFQIIFHDAMETAYEAVQRGQEVVGNGAQMHVAAGLGVLVLVIIRLITRFWRGVPAPVEGGSPMQEKASKTVHWALYLLMVIVPASGVAAWGGGIKPAADAHEVLTTVLFSLIFLHTLAALYHHYFLKDGLIRRMMKAG